MLNMTSWPKVVRQCHRTYPRLSRSRSFAHRNLRQQSTGTTAKTDFLEIEKRWQSKWDSKGTKIQQELEYATDNQLLVPLYMHHIGQKTILSTIQRIRTTRRGSKWSKNEDTNELEEILFANYQTSSDSQKEELLTYSRKYGSEIVRACIIFRSQNDARLHPSEDAVMDTQAWFEKVSYAVRVAHRSFKTINTPPWSTNRESDDGYVEETGEHNMGSKKFMLRIPPYDAVPDKCAGKDACALSLASQKAILAMVMKSESVDFAALWVHLDNLVKHITCYYYLDLIDCGLHYHSARILLSLLAIIAPAFAEECWVALQYGFEHPDGNGIKCNPIAINCAENLQDDGIVGCGSQHLPRLGRLDTLSSIFSQPFPKLESFEVFCTLRRRSVGSELTNIARAGDREQFEEFFSALSSRNEA